MLGESWAESDASELVKARLTHEFNNQSLSYSPIKVHCTAVECQVNMYALISVASLLSKPLPFGTLTAEHSVTDRSNSSKSHREGGETKVMHHQKGKQQDRSGSMSHLGQYVVKENY